MPNILVVSDSRGKLLKPILESPSGSNICFKVRNGATLQDAMSIVKEKLTNESFVCAYIIAGICSITKKEGGYIYLPYETKEDIVKSTTQIIREMLQELDRSTVIPIVLCTIPGADIARANDQEATEYHPQQSILNSAMLEINEYIVDLNLSRGFTTPMLSSTIHKCHGKKKDGSKRYRHHLHKLWDGVHPTGVTLKDWRDKLEENFSQFLFNPELL